MSRIDLPTVILTQVPTRTRLADTRALMQRVQAAAEREWERELAGRVILPVSEEAAGADTMEMEDERWG